MIFFSLLKSRQTLRRFKLSILLDKSMILLAFAEGSPQVQLLPDGTLLIHIALILLMIYVLNRTLFRPINRVIEARVKKGVGGLSEADEILKDVSERQARYEAALLKARSEGYELIEKERSKAIKKRETDINKAKAEVQRKLAEEKETLNKQTAEVRRQIAREAVEMAEKISSNILRA